MPFWKRVAAFLLFLLLLLPSAPVFGEGGGEEAAPSESVTTDRETGKTHRAVRDDDLCRQIETIYRAAKRGPIAPPSGAIAGPMWQISWSCWASTRPM